MVLSCLVEPLVPPLTGRGTGGPRRSALAGTRLAMTALAASIVALSGASFKGEKVHAPAKAESTVVCNAHKRPDAIPYRVQFAHLYLAAELEKLAEPGEAACFEQKALGDHRLRDKKNLIRDTGPGLGLALRLDRLRGGSAETWLRFGSGVHQSGLASHTA
jgi:hypothetical protein